jgi:ubiquinone/menaquinone biosynthesis C-methylase UbiE
MLDPKKVVDNWDIRPEMMVADFGCGSGHYSLEVARRIGGEGIIYALDIQPSVLSALKSRASLEHLANLETRRVDLEVERGTQLADEILDLVVLSNVLFQVEDKEAVIREALRVLKRGGKAALVEWEISDSPMGPPRESRISRKEAELLFKRIGFSIEKEFEASDFHYGIVFKKP